MKLLAWGLVSYPKVEHQDRRPCGCWKHVDDVVVVPPLWEDDLARGRAH
jgi:hypothetical protein